MTRSLPKSLIATLAVLCIVVASCGDDENPAATDSPCSDAACLTTTLTIDEMTHSEDYHSFDDETSHSLSWDVTPLVIFGYAPGKHVMVTLTFDPPLEVQYDHSITTFTLYAGAVANTDRYSQPTVSLEANDWTSNGFGVTCQGESGTGASGLQMFAWFQPLVEGTKLQSLAFDFVVPDTYISGASSGAAILPGNLPVVSLVIETYVDGDKLGSPPVWPGDFIPAVTR